MILVFPLSFWMSILIHFCILPLLYQVSRILCFSVLKTLEFLLEWLHVFYSQPRVRECPNCSKSSSLEVFGALAQSWTPSSWKTIIVFFLQFSHCFMRFGFFSISYEALQNLVSACFLNFDSCHFHSPSVHGLIILIQIPCIFTSLCLCTFLFTPWNAPLPPTLCLICSLIVL